MIMYYFYLGDVLMPVTPGKLKTKIKNENKTLSLASGGEINVLKQPGLTELSFDLLLPAVRYPFAVYDNDVFKSPNYFLSYIEELKTSRQAFDFIVIRMLSAETLLRASAKLESLPSAVLSGYDLNGDGKLTAADARILLRSQGKNTAILSDTHMRCSVEDYTVEEDSEKYGRDFLVSLRLKQYKEYAIKTADYSILK